jgi:hypothetical protein
MKAISENGLQSSLDSLIEQRGIVENRIKQLHNDKENTSDSITKTQIEQHIRLLMRRMNSINTQLYNLCHHKYGQPDYGYQTCNVCGHLKSSRHS